MADKIPLKATYTGSDTTGLAEFGATDTILGSYINTTGSVFPVDLTADQSWTGSQRSTLVVDNDGSFDMNGGNNFSCTPAGAITLTFTNITNGQSGYILMINAGGQTVSLAATSKGDANLATTVSTAGTYLISYLADGTNVYLTTSAVFV